MENFSCQKAVQPTFDLDKAIRCTQIQAIAQSINKRLRSCFLIDFCWGSSLLAGGTYSALDTEALIQYGQRNQAKPTADAVLVLNHKRAAEYLWKYRDLSVPHICAMHALLTSDHGLRDVAESDHFLPERQRGRPDRDKEVKLADIVAVARALHPVQAALHLMTRLPYLQAFANGNKRTARLAANAPLLNGGLLPFSFADVDKREYIRAMAAFYELGDMHVMEQTFVHGYARSVLRGSEIPAAQRSAGFDMAGVANALADFINTGRLPQSQAARAFIKSPPA